MNTATARQARPLSTPAVRTRNVRRMFSVVSAKPKQRKVTLPIIVMLVVLVVIVSFPLLINTQLAMMSYQIHDYKVELNKINETNQALEVQLDKKSSSERLRKVAVKNGMVPAATSGQITLKTKEVVPGVVATE